MHYLTVIVMMLMITTNSFGIIKADENKLLRATIKNKMTYSQVTSEPVVVTWASDGWWWRLWQGITTTNTNGGVPIVSTNTCLYRYEQKFPLIGVEFIPVISSDNHYKIRHTFQGINYYLCVYGMPKWTTESDMSKADIDLCQFVTQQVDGDRIYKIGFVNPNLPNIVKWIRPMMTALIGGTDQYMCLNTDVTTNVGSDICGNGDEYCSFQLRPFSEVGPNG
jgi:hypothetical protein